MKTVTIKDIGTVVNGYDEGNKNDLLNSILCLMSSLADCYKNSDLEVHRKYAEVLAERSNKGYKMLDSLGYYDDLRK